MPKKRRRSISSSEGGNPKVVMVQGVVSSDAPISVPKVCPGNVAHIEPPLVPVSVPKTEASNLWDAKDKADGDGVPSIALIHVKCQGPFTCFSCGKLYKYKSRYDKHRKKCADVAGGVLSSSLVSPSFSAIKEIKIETTEPSLDKSNNGDRGYLPSSLDTLHEPGVASADPSLEGLDPVLRVQHWVKDSIPTDQLVYCCSVPYCGQSFIDEGALRDHQGEHSGCGPDDGGNVKSRKVERVLGDQVLCETLGSNSSAKSLGPHTNSLSMIQISNVMSLAMSQEFLAMTEEVDTSTWKGREPEGGDPSASRGKDVTPRHKAWGNGKPIRRNTDKISDKLSWRSWVQRYLRNRTRATPKWLNPGGRRALCLLCGMRFSRTTALDHHMASAHYESFHYRCCSCNMTFKIWTCLCRHVLQVHCVKIQRSSKTTEQKMAKKCILKTKDKEIAKEKFIHNVKDATIGDGSLGQLVNDVTRQNSEIKTFTIDGSPHLCLFAIKDVQKGEEIVFNQGRVDLPWHTSTQSKMTQTLRTYSKNEAAVLCAFPGQKVNKEECLSRLLAKRTEELESERRQSEARVSAIEERHMAAIESLQSDLQKQVIELMAANQKLAEELAAARTPPAPETLQLASTPPTNSLSSRPKKQHPDMVIPELKPERERKISQLSEGRSDRYGCYLFQAAVGTKKYHTWCCNTNWSGAGGKWGLPRNLQEYLLNTLAKKFPGFGYRETRMFIERINELLRKPRHFLYI